MFGNEWERRLTQRRPWIYSLISGVVVGALLGLVVVGSWKGAVLIGVGWTLAQRFLFGILDARQTNNDRRW
jgi:hypothetical protein